MNQLLKTASILAVISFLAAGILAVTEKVTREPIARVATEKKRLAREALVPSASFALFMPEVFQAADVDTAILAALRSRGLDTAWNDCYRKDGKHYLLKDGVADTKKDILLDALGKAGAGKAFWAALAAQARKAGSKPFAHLSGISRVYVGKKADNALSGFVFECVSPEGYGGDIELVTGIVLLSNGTPAIRDYIVIKSGETPGLGKKAEDILHATVTNPAAGVRTMSNYSAESREKDVISGATITSMAIKDALYASLQYASVLKDQLAPAAEIPPAWLQLIPYGAALEKLSTGGNAFVQTLYGAKWFAQTMGHVALIPLRLFNATAGTYSRLILAVGIQNGGRLYTSRLFEYDVAGKAYKIIPDGTLGFYNTTEDDVKKNAADEKEPVRKTALEGILAAYSLIRSGGR